MGTNSTPPIPFPLLCVCKSLAWCISARTREADSRREGRVVVVMVGWGMSIAYVKAAKTRSDSRFFIRRCFAVSLWHMGSDGFNTDLRMPESCSGEDEHHCCLTSTHGLSSLRKQFATLFFFFSKQFSVRLLFFP